MVLFWGYFPGQLNLEDIIELCGCYFDCVYFTVILLICWVCAGFGLILVSVLIAGLLDY